MGFVKEFKEFALRGNVIDLAVGVIIGGAFGKITSSVIDDLMMPLLGKIIGNVDFSNLYLPLSHKVPYDMHLAEARKLGPVFAYGNFISVMINFVLLALCVFMLIKIINSIQKKEAEAPPPPAVSTTEKLLEEIRDSLKK
jgi:large conductance mechanosensitive channel